MKRSKDNSERVSQKSAAEFFSEHQQIAGFDNPGKSLYTTIRELVENSLDAAESIHVLPDIQVSVVEYTEEEHNARHGIYKSPAASSAGKTPSSKVSAKEGDDLQIPLSQDGLKASGGQKKKKSLSTGGEASKALNYYDIKCRDNGCGIPADKIGDMLGRVLSGSKHGVRQTRGKFGLGAKMALIWSKKSSGLPITIRTAHSTSPSNPSPTVTTVVLDIDIHRNEPKILSKKVEPNKEQWRGVELSVTICGNWSTYRSRVLQYFQQLAVITPYAHLQLSFSCSREEKKGFTAEFMRRSEQMPPAAKEVPPHPKSLNHITLSRLLKESKAASLNQFLTKSLSGINLPVAKKITESINEEDSSPSSLSSSKVAALCQTLRDDMSIKPPVSSCLSPAGEYNMRLGVLKELRPKLVATFTDKSSSHEGHPFLVEAAVSIGGKEMKEGINIYRFANRIPLLFETGADVVTQVATKKINWTSYHIDVKKESVGVYVSIVSTRIPFKGTSKEYIGEDVTEMMHSVRRAILGCCQQLRISLARNRARKDEQERRKTLEKYIPDVSRALYIVLDKMREKRRLTLPEPESIPAGPNAKRSRTEPIETSKVMGFMSEGLISESILAAKLQTAVDHMENESMLQAASSDIASKKTEKVYLKQDFGLSRAPEPGELQSDSTSSRGRWVYILPPNSISDSVSSGDAQDAVKAMILIA